MSKYKNTSEATEEMYGNITCLLHNKEGIFPGVVFSFETKTFHSGLTHCLTFVENMYMYKSQVLIQKED